MHDLIYGSESSSKDPGAYWRKIKQRLKKEGNEVVTKCHGLKLDAADGKNRDEKTFRKHVNNVISDGEIEEDNNTQFMRVDLF